MVAVTDHAVERYRQRVRGSLEPRVEVAARVGRALASGRVEPGQRGATLVRDLEQPSLVYVCMEDRVGDRLVVLTVWDEGRSPGGGRSARDRREDAAVPRKWTR